MNDHNVVLVEPHTKAFCESFKKEETMFIRVNDPSLNRNLGKDWLPHIWDEVMQDTPTLHFRYPSTATPQLAQPLHGTHGEHTHILSTLVLSIPRDCQSPLLAPVSVRHKLVPSVVVLSLCLLAFLFKWLANAYLLFQLLLVSFIT